MTWSPHPLATHRYTLLCADVDADISPDTKSCQAKWFAIQPTARPSRCSPALVCHECFQSHSMLNNWQKNTYSKSSSRSLPNKRYWINLDHIGSHQTPFQHSSLFSSAGAGQQLGSHDQHPSDTRYISDLAQHTWQPCQGADVTWCLVWCLVATKGD